MLVVMEQDASEQDIARVVKAIEEMGYEARPMPGEQRTAIGVVGNDKRVDSTRIEGLPNVREVIHVSAPFKLVSREWRKESTVITLDNGTKIGGDAVCVMAGPCAVETEAQLMKAAEIVRDAGVTVLRGGAFKPRTSPYAFQGLGKEGLEILARAKKRFNLAIVTEAIDDASADLVAEYADIVQIGARNMQNFSLLKHVGRLKRPVLLKRGMSATIKEFLLAAEYIASEGNEQLILCERGIRSFDDSTRNVLDIAAVPVIKHLSHLPTIADPSHGTGRRDKVAPMARAAVAAGADGVIIEMHPEPDKALSDGMQSLYPAQFYEMVRDLDRVAQAIDRRLVAADAGR